MPHLVPVRLVALLALALAACVQPKERQVVQSKDPIEVGLRGQRERLLAKASELEALGRSPAALTIYESLLALYPDDVEIRARAATARRTLERDAVNGSKGAVESDAVDAGDDEDP